MSMWQEDIVYGGEQLEPNVHVSTTGDAHHYILWDAGIVAEDVKTSLGDDGTKVEVIISALNTDGTVTEPAKYGTFASAIVGKVGKKTDGDLPAVIRFEKIDSTKYEGQAFVMTFVRRWTALPPEGYEMPTISVVGALAPVAAAKGKPASKPASKRAAAVAAAGDSIPF